MSTHPFYYSQISGRLNDFIMKFVMLNNPKSSFKNDDVNSVKRVVCSVIDKAPDETHFK